MFHKNPEIVDYILDELHPVGCFRCGGEVPPLAQYANFRGMIYCLPCFGVLVIGDKESRLRRYRLIH